MMSLLSILPRSSLQPSLFSPLPPGKIHRFPCLKLHRPFPRLLLLRAVRSLPSYDEDLFRSFTSPSQGGDEGPTLLPGVRSYENDLARLTVVGAIGYDLAMTAAAADGGHAARQHLSSGSQTMVVETLFPGSLDEHSTISTKLFLPARKVNEVAKKVRSRLSSELLGSNFSGNILAMTFRQVVFQYAWNVEIVLFPPGVERDMNDLTKTRETLVYFTMSSSDDKLLSALAEVVCSSAFDDIEKNQSQVTGSLIPNSFLHLFNEPKVTSSKDSSVCLTRIPKSVILDEAEKWVEIFNLAKWKPTYRERGSKNKWWTPPTYFSHDKDVGPWFSAWINEYIPAYKIQVDWSRFKNTKFEGLPNSSENRSEVLLTHFQMDAEKNATWTLPHGGTSGPPNSYNRKVELANILDMFYEDRFTLPQKQLSCSCIERLTPTSQSKSSKWQMILLPVAWGFLLVSFGILSRVFAPHLVMARKAFELPKPALISDSNFCQIQSLGIVELEPLCNSVVERIKDSLGFSGNILFDPIIGAWTGQLPAYFKRESDAGIYEESVTSNGETNSTPSSNLVDETGLSDCCKPLSGEDSQVQFGLAQDIASYQVVFTNAGQIIGFQPTNRVAVNYWAGNRFAKLLYCGKKLSPGLLEPGLKVPHPDKVILIELLLSVNPKSWFALARPFKT